MPQSLDMDEQQKRALCKKLGANAAEIASSIFLANCTSEIQNNQQPQQVMYAPQVQYQQPQYVPVQPVQQMPMNGQMVYPSPMQSQQQPMNGNMPQPAYG